MHPGAESTVVALERVRLAGRDPTFRSVRGSARKLVSGELDLAAFGYSPLSATESQRDVWLANSRARISAATVEAILRRCLGVSDGVPWPLRERANYNAQGRPAPYSED